MPLVVDMSSDICSKSIDWGRVGVAFACAPKNIGHAGLTIVIVRRGLIEGGKPSPVCPGEPAAGPTPHPLTRKDDSGLVRAPTPTM